MSLLNTLLGSSKKLREFPAEPHYGCIFPQFITSQSMGVSPTACPRAVLAVRTKPLKEKSFSKGPGHSGHNNSKTERLWLPAPTAQAQLPAPNLPCSSQIPSGPPGVPYIVLFQEGFSLVQSLANLLFQFPLCRVVPTARGAGWQLQEMLGKKKSVSG